MYLTAIRGTNRKPSAVTNSLKSHERSCLEGCFNQIHTTKLSATYCKALTQGSNCGLLHSSLCLYDSACTSEGVFQGLPELSSAFVRSRPSVAAAQVAPTQSRHFFASVFSIYIHPGLITVELMIRSLPSSCSSRLQGETVSNCVFLGQET